jgi:hypothetical protein
MRATPVLLRCLVLVLFMSSLAAAETFVTKDGTVYVGDVVIRGKNTIVLRTDEGKVTLNREDLLDLPPVALEARCHLWKGKQGKAKADKALAVNDLGMAMYFYEASILELTAIDAALEEEFALAQGLIEEVKAQIKDVVATLEERGLAAYQGQLFKKEVLDYHLHEGHILVGTNVWIAPSQRCSRCEAKGWIRCEACASQGWRDVTCPNCEGGRATCPRCGGTGAAPCTECKGTGKYTVNCPKCNGTGSITCSACNGKGTIWRYYYPYYPYRYRVTCPKCSGRGTVTCTWCGGKKTVTAPCPQCQGKGRVACPKTVQCPDCKGTGKLRIRCDTCGGRGYVTCPDCHGKGYTGTPCPDSPMEQPAEQPDTEPATTTTDD